MACLGDSFCCPKPDNPVEHLWVVLTDPCPNTGEVIIVNITSKQGHSDTTTVLVVGDHPYVKKPSVVYYADARIVTAKQIDAVMAEGSGHPHKACVRAMLDKVQKGLLASPHTKPKIKHAFQQAQEEGRDKPSKPATL